MRKCGYFHSFIHFSFFFSIFFSHHSLFHPFSTTLLFFFHHLSQLLPSPPFLSTSSNHSIPLSHLHNHPFRLSNRVKERIEELETASVVVAEDLKVKMMIELRSLRLLNFQKQVCLSIIIIIHFHKQFSPSTDFPTSLLFS